MIDPQDDKTDPLPLSDTAAAAAPAPPATTAPRLSLAASWDIQPPDEKMLREQHDLVRIRTPVYAWDKKEAKKKSESAERVEKFRKKQAAEGLRPAAVPIVLLDAVKAAGGWTEWQEQKAASAEAIAMEKATAAAAADIEKAKATAAAAAPPAEIVEEVKAAGGWSAWLTKKTAAATPPAPAPEPKIVIQKVEVAGKLGKRDSASIELGRQVEALTGLKAAVVRWLL